MPIRTPRLQVGHVGAISLYTAAKPTAVPSAATDGFALTAGVANRWMVKVRATAGGSPSTVATAKVYVYDGFNWYFFKTLNGGTSLVVGDATGSYLEILADIGWAARVDFAAASSSQNIEVSLAPVLEHEY